MCDFCRFVSKSVDKFSLKNVEKRTKIKRQTVPGGLRLERIFIDEYNH